MQSPINAVLNIARRHIADVPASPLAQHRGRNPQLPLNLCDDTPTGVQLLKLFETHLAKKPKGFPEPVGATGTLPASSAEESVNQAFASILQAVTFYHNQALEQNPAWPTPESTPWLVEVLSYEFTLNSYCLLRSYVRFAMGKVASDLKLNSGAFEGLPAEFSMRLGVAPKAAAGTLTLTVDAVDTVNSRYEQRTFDVPVASWGQPVSLVKAVEVMNDMAAEFEKALLMVAEELKQGTLFKESVRDPEVVQATHLAKQALSRMTPVELAVLKRHADIMVKMLVNAGD